MKYLFENNYPVEEMMGDLDRAIWYVEMALEFKDYEFIGMAHAAVTCYQRDEYNK